MFLLLICLVMLNGLAAVLMWLAWRRISEHTRNNPEAAELVAKTIALLLTVKKEE